LEEFSTTIVAISRYRDLGSVLFITALTISVIGSSALTALTIVPEAGAALAGLVIAAIARPIVIAF